MTVKELINLLRVVPENCEVFLIGRNNSWDAVSVEKITYDFIREDRDSIFPFTAVGTPGIELPQDLGEMERCVVIRAEEKS